MREACPNGHGGVNGLIFVTDGPIVASAASHSGFGSDENLRRAFHHYLKIAPTTYQHRFATTARAASA
jgi:AraC-like DNA-binding protein